MIKEIAARDNAVIIGRGAQVVLRDDPRALHLYIYGPAGVRRGGAWRNGRPRRANGQRIVRESDHNRSGFLKSYYGRQLAGSQALRHDDQHWRNRPRNGGRARAEGGGGAYKAGPFAKIG